MSIYIFAIEYFHISIWVFVYMYLSATMCDGVLAGQVAGAGHQLAAMSATTTNMPTQFPLTASTQWFLFVYLYKSHFFHIFVFAFSYICICIYLSTTLNNVPTQRPLTASCLGFYCNLRMISFFTYRWKNLPVCFEIEQEIFLPMAQIYQPMYVWANPVSTAVGASVHLQYSGS